MEVLLEPRQHRADEIPIWMHRSNLRESLHTEPHDNHDNTCYHTQDIRSQRNMDVIISDLASYLDTDQENISLINGR
jgi:hypothetical protein